MIVLEYKVKAALSQLTAVNEAIRTAQFIRKKCLHYWMDRRGIKPYDLNKYCVVLAAHYPFAQKLNSMARQASTERAAAAINRFYDICKKKPGKKGYPQFRHNGRSVAYKTTGWKLDASRTHLTLTDGFGIGRLALKGTRDLGAYALEAIKRVRLVWRADGCYAQFCLDVERVIQVTPMGHAVGIDVGLQHFYTDSTGTTVANPRCVRASERALKRLQRRVSAKKKGGNNRTKARARLARKHLKVSRQRQDFAVKAARALIMSNDVIVYEDLRVANLLQNRHLAKSISDAGWRQFMRWLHYLARVYGKVAVVVPPQYTSQACSGCGAVVTKTLSERTHLCPSCHAVLDRDHNAARNILALGLHRLETTVGHTERYAWGQYALYPPDVDVVGKAAE
jgi:putative transposase